MGRSGVADRQEGPPVCRDRCSGAGVLTCEDEPEQGRRLAQRRRGEAGAMAGGGGSRRSSPMPPRPPSTSARSGGVPPSSSNGGQMIEPAHGASGSQEGG